MDLKIYIILVYFNILVPSVFCNTCANMKTCSDCIMHAGACVWCADNNDKFEGKRCKAESSVDSTWCSEVINPQSKIEPSRNLNLSSDGTVIQFKPQEFNVVIRPGQEVSFDFEFKAAKHYPVDVYFLIDASNDMIEMQEALHDQTLDIYKTLSNFTKDTRMGYGTYVDKKALPFISNYEQNSYSFKHHLKLTDDATMFKDTMTKTINTQTQNRDPPESGLDALAQVLACDEPIGWRSKSRKIVVLMTGGPIHKVGDGALAGITEPFDGGCHTDDTGTYTKETEFDYPSTGMINKLATERKATVIFLITDPAYNVSYETFTRSIGGSKKLVFQLKGKNEELTKVLRQIYEDITKDVRLVAKKKNYEIKFVPDCTKEGCSVAIEETKLFKGHITLLKDYGARNDIIDVTIQGVNDDIRLNVNIDSKCKCKPDTKNTECNGETFECGICICKGTKQGKNCNCDPTNDPEKSIDDKDCIKDGEMCSVSKDSKSHCVCGACVCGSDNLFGLYCQFDKGKCKHGKETEECSGHGKCTDVNNREQCVCSSGWKGSMCDCSLSSEACDHTEMGVTNTCYGRGNCICNKCDCFDAALWDKRGKSDDPKCKPKPCLSSGCHKLQCDAARSCAMCHIDSDDCASHCGEGILLDHRHDTIPSEYLNKTRWEVCDHEKTDMGCYTKFIYKYDDDKYKLLIRVQKNSNCAESFYIYGGILLASLLLVGIATLLVWKCVTSYQDRREYEIFEKKHAEILTGACSNPLYDEPAVTFHNPTFEGTKGTEPVRQRGKSSYAKGSDTVFKNPT